VLQSKEAEADECYDSKHDPGEREYFFIIRVKNAERVGDVLTKPFGYVKIECLNGLF